MRLLAHSLFFLTISLGHSIACVAQNLPQSNAWDCWVGTDDSRFGSHFLRCIVDRDTLKTDVFEENSVVLDEIHRLVHEGQIEDAERSVKTNVKVFGHGNLWSIRIHRYPDANSWATASPERLVRALLCPADGECTVNIRQH